MLEKIGKFKLLIVGALVSLLFIAVTIGQLQRQQEIRSRAAGQAVSVILDPLTKSINVGGNLAVQVNINGADNNISAVDISFTYDSNLLQLLSYSPSSLFTTIINDSNTLGTIHYVGVNPTSNPITGSSINIGALVFKGKATGTAKVGFSNIHINASGVPGALPVNTENTKEGTYTINDSPHVTSTPSPTPATGSCNSDCINKFGYTAGTCIPFADGNACISGGGGIINADCGSGSCCCTKATPTPTAKPTATKAPTPTPTTKPVATSTPLPTTPLVTSTPVPPGSTLLAISATMPGIGGTSGNKTPKRPSREAKIVLLDSQNHAVPTTQGNINFDGTKFSGTINLLANFVSGTYSIKIKFDNTLFKLVPGIQNIIAATTNQIPQVTLVPGDIDGNNILDILDWNIILGCVKSDAACSESKKVLADLNDDGKVDEMDLNIILRGFASRNGD